MKASDYFKIKTKKDLLYNLCPLKNLVTVLSCGLLSHRLAAELNHQDLSDRDVQFRRECKNLHNGKPLHEYANLFFDYRNPMFYRLCREGKREDIAIVAFDSAVLDMPECIVSDRNAASDYASFYDPIAGLESLRFDLVYAQYWADSGDPVQDAFRRSIKNAEVLVPEAIPSSYIRFVFVYNERAKARILAFDKAVEIAVRPEMYF